VRIVQLRSLKTLASKRVPRSKMGAMMAPRRKRKKAATLEEDPAGRKAELEMM